MEHKLMDLRAAVRRLPQVPGEDFGDALTDFEREEPIEEATDLQEVFATLLAAWNIPHDVQPALSLVEIQERMAEGLPEN
jgi:hypothetical protein